MTTTSIAPTGREIHFDADEIIVSKTDPRGIITYANDIFCRVSGYSEAELLGQPHNIIRHPEMPACVFKLLWDTLKSGHEIFAYVNNLARCGSNYWVFAHVTPSHDREGRLVGYHSSRRVPYPDALQKVRPLYARLRSEETRHADPRQGMAASMRLVGEVIQGAGMDYPRFVFSLSKFTQLEAVAS